MDAAAVPAGSSATLATLHVVRPQSSGTGGNGFFTIYDKATDRVYSLGATGAAPMTIDPAAMTRQTLNKGIHAGVIPGLFGGWIAVLDRFGTMSLADVLKPAIDYADNGHPIETSVARSVTTVPRRFTSSRRRWRPHTRPG